MLCNFALCRMVTNVFQMHFWGGRVTRLSWQHLNLGDQVVCFPCHQAKIYHSIRADVDISQTACAYFDKDRSNVTFKTMKTKKSHPHTHASRDTWERYLCIQLLLSALKWWSGRQEAWGSSQTMSPTTWNIPAKRIRWAFRVNNGTKCLSQALIAW